uniref:FBD domain-containing protein n=1 Tax=Aegilops tauschii subsp. strangulata TaxID=200361 RepID=A0A453C462_AEGTS
MSYLREFSLVLTGFISYYVYYQIMSVNLTKLTCPSFQAQVTCPSGCICDQPLNWKSEELILNCLQEIEINGFGGTEHEVALVKLLFNWAAVLKKMTIAFHYSIPKRKAEELGHMLLGFSSPEILMDFLHIKYSREGACSTRLQLSRSFQFLEASGVENPNAGM